MSHQVLTINSGIGKFAVSKYFLNSFFVSISGLIQAPKIFLVALTISSCHP
ncbi:hypothetical protein HOB94_02385 [bacterium]|nr:hypothetical protein [bacterium]